MEKNTLKYEVRKEINRVNLKLDKLDSSTKGYIDDLVWNTQERVKLHRKRDYLLALEGMIDSEDATIESILTYLKSVNQGTMDYLLRGNLSKQSSNAIDNLVFTWQREAECEHISLYCFYIKLLEDKEIEIK